MAPQHSADLAGPSRRIRFGKNLLLILARVGAPFRASYNLRIRAGRFAPARRQITRYRIRYSRPL